MLFEQMLFKKAKKVISKNINSALMIVLFTELVEAIQKFLMLFSRLSVTLDQHNSNQKIFCLSRDALLPAFYENPEFILEEEIENARYGLRIGDFGIDISNIEGMVRFSAILPNNPSPVPILLFFPSNGETLIIQFHRFEPLKRTKT